MTFLSKILDQEDQHRILALLQPDPLAEHSQARGAELQESVASTSTLEQREGLSSSKQVENLIDPQEPKAKKRRSFTQTKREHYDLGWDDVSRKFDSMGQGAASSHQTMKETRQQENEEKLTLDEIEELVTEVCRTPNFQARKFEPTSEEIQSLVKKLDKTGLDEEQWDHTKRFLSEKNVKAKNSRYTYFYSRTASTRNNQRLNNTKMIEKINSIYGDLTSYRHASAQKEGFKNEYARRRSFAQEKGFTSEYARRNARAQKGGYINEHSRKNARAQNKGFNNQHHYENDLAKKKGFKNKHQYYKNNA